MLPQPGRLAGNAGRDHRGRASSRDGKVVQEALAAKITRVWLQRGAESAEAIRFCTANGIQVISGECILMFAEPAAFYHKIHRFFRGKLKE